MQAYLNKRVKIFILYNKEELFFTATVLEVTDNHITFEDKYKEKYTFKKKYVEEISPL